MKESMTEPWDAITVVWVFQPVFGYLLSHRPSTLAVSVPLD